MYYSCRKLSAGVNNCVWRLTHATCSVGYHGRCSLQLPRLQCTLLMTSQMFNNFLRLFSSSRNVVNIIRHVFLYSCILMSIVWLTHKDNVCQYLMKEFQRWEGEIKSMCLRKNHCQYLPITMRIYYLEKMYR